MPSLGVQKHMTVALTRRHQIVEPKSGSCVVESGEAIRGRRPTGVGRGLLKKAASGVLPIFPCSRTQPTLRA
jgi:hypothetical protein